MKLGFIGTGNMASAIMGGIINNQVIRQRRSSGLICSLREESGCRTVWHPGNGQQQRSCTEGRSDHPLCKPQFYADVIREIKDEIKDSQIIITIAPGKTLAWLEEQFGKQVKIVRTMPNTPAMVGAGMTAACPNPYLSEEEIAYVKTLLQSFSRVEIIPERLMDVVYLPAEVHRLMYL